MKKIMKLMTILLVISIIFTMAILTIYPISYIDLVMENSKKYNLDPILVLSIINVESKFNKKAQSHKGARGLMQIGEETGKWGASELGIENYSSYNLFEPKINISIGTWYLNKLYAEFNGNLPVILAAYNAGSGNVASWLNNPEYSRDGFNLDHIPFKETEDYLVRVENKYKVYNRLYSKLLEKDNKLFDIILEVIVEFRLKLKDYINK